MPLSLSAVHCGGKRTCEDRGGQQTFVGSEQYVGTLGDGDAGAGTGVFGSRPQNASIDWDPREPRDTGGIADGDPCARFDVEISVTLLSTCTLRGNMTSTEFTNPGRGGGTSFVSATANLNGGQTCDLPVPGGIATVAIDRGTIQWDDLQSTTIVFSGRVARWPGSPGSSAYLTYTFKGVQ